MMLNHDPVTFKHQNCQQRNETVVTMATIVRVRLIGVLVASGVVTVPLKVRHPGTISSGPLSAVLRSGSSHVITTSKGCWSDIENEHAAFA
jgi:hypothetical protein